MDLQPPCEGRPVFLLQKVAVMDITKTVLKVQKNKLGTHVWIITRNDNDPESVGTVTASGVPCPAELTGVGSKFETIFTPKELL